MCQASNLAVTHSVQHFIDKANSLYNLDLGYPAVGFQVKGVGFNTGLMVDNLAHYVEQVAPHEVAHLVCYVLQGNQYEYKYTRRGQRRRVSHGKLFYKVMRAFGVDETRCHSMDTSKVKRATRKTTKHPVMCACGWTASVGTVRANKIMRGTQYRHRASCPPITLISAVI